MIKRWLVPMAMSLCLCGCPQATPPPQSFLSSFSSDAVDDAVLQDGAADAGKASGLDAGDVDEQDAGVGPDVDSLPEAATADAATADSSVDADAAGGDADAGVDAGGGWVVRGGLVDLGVTNCAGAWCVVGGLR